MFDDTSIYVNYFRKKNKRLLIYDNLFRNKVRCQKFILGFNYQYVWRIFNNEFYFYHYITQT